MFYNSDELFFQIDTNQQKKIKIETCISGLVSHSFALETRNYTHDEYFVSGGTQIDQWVWFIYCIIVAEAKKEKKTQSKSKIHVIGYT